MAEDAPHTSVTLFRADPKNVGDWWSPPVRYFPLRARTEMDLVGDLSSLEHVRTVIVGGGGLGRAGIMGETLARIARPDRPYKLIAWGVGADTVSDRKAILPENTDVTELNRYFDGFDLVGTRIHANDGYAGDDRLRWVPCASSMHPDFLALRKTRPVAAVGLYAHRRVSIPHHTFRDIARGMGQRLRLGRLPRDDNTGRDIGAKLRFLAQHEYIVTNSYHGVFWATLLGRKAVCLAFKDGLFSFRHRPAYFDPAQPEKAFDEARIHDTALDECRAANLGFHREVVERFGDV